MRVRAGERLTVSFTLRVAIVERATVTAAKSGEREVQTLPMAISAVSDAELGRLGTHTLGEGAALAPSVTLSQNAGFGQLTIRGIGTNVVFAGSDPSSAMYLDGVYLARPAMEFVQFLDLDRIEVLRGPQGTLYGRNAVGGAMNLISRRPTNDFLASAEVTAGSFAALRASARLSGPIKRDRLMGSVAVARGVRDGYVRDLDHPDHPLGADDVTAARGQLRFVFDRRTDLVLSSDIDHQDGTPLAFNKVVAAKPGFQFDNPPDLHDVRTSTLNSNRIVHSGASARLTAALTPATTLVSLTAFRRLDYEFLNDGDVTELDVLAARQHEWQNQLSEEFTVSHQRPGLSWVAGVFLFDEFDQQSIRLDQPAPRLQVRLDPRVDAASRAVFGETTVGLTSRLSATAGVRYTHEGKDIANAGGRYGLDAPYLPVADSTYGYSDSITHSAWTPKVGLDVTLPNGAISYVSATRGFKSGGFNPSSTMAGRGYAPEWAWSYEAGVERRAHGRPVPIQRVCLRDGLHGPAGADAGRDRGVRHPQCRGGDDSRRRNGDHLTDWSRHPSRRPCHLARRDLRSVHRGRQRRDDRGCRGQPVEQRAGMGRPPVDRVEWRRRSIASSLDRGRHDSAVDGVLHAVQRQHPATGGVRPAGCPRRIRTRQSPVGRRRLRPKRH